MLARKLSLYLNYYTSILREFNNNEVSDYESLNRKINILKMLDLVFDISGNCEYLRKLILDITCHFRFLPNRIFTYDELKYVDDMSDDLHNILLERMKYSYNKNIIIGDDNNDILIQIHIRKILQQIQNIESLNVLFPNIIGDTYDYLSTVDIYKNIHILEDLIS